MLCKTPVVTLSTPWFDNSQCEVIGHNIGGLVCVSKKGFKFALIELIKNKKLRIKLGESSRTKIIESYDHIKVCNTLLEKFLKIKKWSLLILKIKYYLFIVIHMIGLIY